MSRPLGCTKSVFAGLKSQEKTITILELTFCWGYRIHISIFLPRSLQLYRPRRFLCYLILHVFPLITLRMPLKSVPICLWIYIGNTWLLQECFCGILTKRLWCFTDSKLPSLSILPSWASTECMHNLSQHNRTIDNSYCTLAWHHSTSRSHDCMSDLCINTIQILRKPPPSENGCRFCFLKPTFQPPVHSKYSWYNQASENPTIFCLLANCFLEQFSSLTCEPFLSSLSLLLLVRSHGIFWVLLYSTSGATVQEFNSLSDQQKC